MNVIPFLYQELVERILSSARDWPRLMIFAGRGLGKSGFLEYLEMEYEELGIDIEWVDKKTEEPEDAIRTWASNPKGILLIDDLDRIFNRDVEKALHVLPEDADGTWRVIVTVCRLEEIDRMEETLSWWGSAILNTFHREALDPWEIPGQVSGAIKDALPLLRDVHQQAGHGWPLHPMLLGKTPDLVEAWVDAILSTTEGHPALLHAAFNALARLLLRYPQMPPYQQRLLNLPEDRAGLRQWQSDVRQYLMEEVYKSAEGMGVIQKAIYYYRRNGKDFDALVELAGKEDGERIDDIRLRHSLRSSGLVYPHPGTGHLKVASTLARQKILEIAETMASAASQTSTTTPTSATTETTKPRRAPSSKAKKRETFRISLEPGPNPDDGGTLRVHEPDGFAPLEIRGSEWAVLRAIAEATGGETARVEAIRASASLETEASVRSALQRLRDKLRKHGLGDLIETVRGKGFRLSRRE